MSMKINDSTTSKLFLCNEPSQFCVENVRESERLSKILLSLRSPLVRPTKYTFRYYYCRKVGSGANVLFRVRVLGT